MLMSALARRLQRAARRLEELRAWRNAREQAIPRWRFEVPGRAPVELAPGDFWPVEATPVRFSAEATVPGAWAGEPVEVDLWLGGEGFVRLSTGLEGGLDPFHHRYPLTEAATGGETVRIEAEVVPKGMFGSRIPEPRIERAHLIVPEVDARALERDLTIVLAAAEQLGDAEVTPRLLDIAEAAFATLAPDWPTATDVVVARIVEGTRQPLGSGLASVPASYGLEAIEVELGTQPIWQDPTPTRPLEPLPAAARAAVERARGVVAAGLAALKADYPPIGRLALTGHAHIDLAWLWPYAETRRKVRRTCASVLALMDRYPDFTHNQSSAQVYAWLEEDAPELFARVRQRVSEGRWEPVGGSWCEPDCQVTGGEAFVRQLLLGQRYFLDRFGTRATVAWLPDVFGFSAGIPQLLRGAGISGFFTIKLTWNEANLFPHDLWTWEGVDGSSVTAFMFRNLHPAYGYNANIAPLDTLGTWRNWRAKGRAPESLMAFGWGDGGGGPSARMLENYARIKDFPALPRLRMARVEEYFAALPKDDLPRWAGELYLELHRGTLTSQGKVKSLNRAAEHRLVEAEAFNALALLDGADYPAAELDRAWKTLLLNQFHDVLPGSSIHEVYEDAHRLLGEVVATATELRDRALAGDGAADALAVGNLAPQQRVLTLLLPGVKSGQPTWPDGSPVPCQVTPEGLLLHDADRVVGELGAERLGLHPGQPAPPELDFPPAQASAADDGALLDNGVLRVEIGADGTIHRLTDLENDGREALTDRGNQLWLYVDKPRSWDAWDVDEGYEAEGWEAGEVERIAVVEAGPLRAAVRVERRVRNSRIIQTYRLLADSRQLEIATELDWHDRHLFLRALFPLAVHTHEATFETMYGAIRRPTHRNTPWDAARFEVSGHRWADLSEPGYGVALLNNGKYGHSVRGNVLGLSLLRSPVYPDRLADEGKHRFAYALFPHRRTWAAAGVPAAAFAFNSPLIGVPGGTARDSFLRIGGATLALGALKRAEDGDGLILRLHEPNGARGAATLRFGRPLASVAAVNLLEEPDPAGAVEQVDARTARVATRPFGVIGLRLRF